MASLGGKGFTSALYKYTGSSQSWTAPAGVTNVILIGIGGGAGGAGGPIGTGVARIGGFSSVPTIRMASVVPGASYNIIIGQKGAGGLSGGQGGVGGDTVFGTDIIFRGATAILNADITNNYFETRGPAGFTIANTCSGATTDNYIYQLQGGISRSYAYPGGALGADNGGYKGGGGGGGGWSGPGGAGGNWNSNGSNAATDNFGAGGGAGGRSVGGPATRGGDGWHGALWIIWSEGGGKLTRADFTSSGSWTCPAGVTGVIALGQGGGGGGGVGNIGNTSYQTGGFGGKATFLTPAFVETVPGTTYSITIGAGGLSASNGGTTSFGALRDWIGALPGGPGSGYLPYIGTLTLLTQLNVPLSLYPKYGASTPYTTQNFGLFGTSGSYTATPFSGSPGNTSDSGIGGIGGTGGPGSVLPGVGGNGGSYGAGGGGGGGTPSTGSFTIGASGGVGGPGRLIIIWAE